MQEWRHLGPEVWPSTPSTDTHTHFKLEEHEENTPELGSLSTTPCSMVGTVVAKMVGTSFILKSQLPKLPRAGCAAAMVGFISRSGPSVGLWKGRCLGASRCLDFSVIIWRFRKSFHFLRHMRWIWDKMHQPAKHIRKTTFGWSKPSCCALAQAKWSCFHLITPDRPCLQQTAMGCSAQSTMASPGAISSDEQSGMRSLESSFDTWTWRHLPKGKHGPPNRLRHERLGQRRSLQWGHVFCLWGRFSAQLFPKSGIWQLKMV